MIVNVLLVLGFVPFSIINPVYNGTKAWVHFWSMALRRQLAEGEGNRSVSVRVVEIAPPTAGMAEGIVREWEEENGRVFGEMAK